MIQQAIFPYKLEITKEVLTGRSGLALMAEFNHGIGLRNLVNQRLPEPGLTAKSKAKGKKKRTRT